MFAKASIELFVCKLCFCFLSFGGALAFVFRELLFVFSTNFNIDLAKIIVYLVKHLQNYFVMLFVRSFCICCGSCFEVGFLLFLCVFLFILFVCFFVYSFCNGL